MKTCLPLLGTTRISCDCTLAGKRSAWFTRREAIERPRERESGREGERSLARRVLRIIRKEKKTVELFFLLLFFLPFFNFYRTSERWCRGKELISKNLNRSPDEKRDYSKRGTNSLSRNRIVETTIILWSSIFYPTNRPTYINLFPVIIGSRLRNEKMERAYSVRVTV